MCAGSRRLFYLGVAGIGLLVAADPGCVETDEFVSLQTQRATLGRWQSHALIGGKYLNDEPDFFKESRRKLQRLHGLEANLRRTVMTAELAATGKPENSLLPAGGRKRKVVLSAVIGAAISVALVAVIGCAFAALSDPAIKDEAVDPFKTRKMDDNDNLLMTSAADSVIGSAKARAARKSHPPVRKGTFSCLVDCCGMIAGACRSAPSAICSCLFGCSPIVLLIGWTFFAAWSAMVVVLWHYGILQPYLKQMLVYVYFLFGVGALGGILVLESLSSLTVVVEKAYATVQFIHDKVDDMLEAIGLETLEGTPNIRVDDQATIQESSTGRRAAREVQHKPAMGSLAWFLNAKRMACC